MTYKIVLVAAAFLLSACATSGGPIGGANSSLRVVSTAELPHPSPTDQLVAGRPYLVGPFDKLRIDVFGVPELSGRIVQADASGRFSFPLLGEVDANGVAPNVVEARMEAQLRGRFLREPDVTINVEESANSFVTLEGEVVQPGVYPVVGNMSLLRAIATARGVNEFARLHEVIVFRTVDGQRYAGVYNLAAIRRGAYDDPAIYASDIIVVGDSPARRVFRDVLQAAPLLSTPLIILFQR